MKKKTVLKIVLDFVMLIIYLQLMFCYEANGLYHEIMGIGIGLLFAGHMALNAKAIANLSKKMMRGALGPAKSALVVSDMLLPFGMVVTIVTGVLIAKDLFVGPGDSFVVVVHEVAAYACLAVLTVHVLLHARYLVGVTKKIVHSDGVRAAYGAAGALTITGILVWANLLGGRTSLALAGQTTSVSSPSALATNVQDIAATSESTTSGSSGKASAAGSSSSEATASSSGSTGSDSAYSASSSTESSSTGTSSPVCPLCPRACPLTSLRCGKGTQWATSNGYLS